MMTLAKKLTLAMRAVKGAIYDLKMGGTGEGSLDWCEIKSTLLQTAEDGDCQQIRKGLRLSLLLCELQQERVCQRADEDARAEKAEQGSDAFHHIRRLEVAHGSKSLPASGSKIVDLFEWSNGGRTVSIPHHVVKRFAEGDLAGAHTEDGSSVVKYGNYAMAININPMDGEKSDRQTEVPPKTDDAVEKRPMEGNNNFWFYKDYLSHRGYPVRNPSFKNNHVVGNTWDKFEPTNPSGSGDCSTGDGADLDGPRPSRSVSLEEHRQAAGAYRAKVKDYFKW